jgi:hypothetical protein
MRVRGKSHFSVIVLTVVTTAVVLGLSGIAGYLFLQNRQLKADIAAYSKLDAQYKDLKAASPQGVGGLNDAERIIKQVSLLAELPQNEIPTLIPIDSQEKVKTIEFFKSAHPGDYVLVYPQAKFAVLYRPSTYKIINMGPQTFTIGSK